MLKLILSCMCISLLTSAKAPPGTDYKIHCLYLYKFSQLTKWPPTNNKKEFTFGIVGVSPIITALEQYLEAKNKSSTLKYKLVRFESIQYITDCDILYVAKNQLSDFDLAVKKMAGKPTLIISEVPGLIKRGACMNMIYEEGSSIKIQINKPAIESHGLKHTPELLKLGSEIF